LLRSATLKCERAFSGYYNAVYVQKRSGLYRELALFLIFELFESFLNAKLFESFLNAKLFESFLSSFDWIEN